MKHVTVPRSYRAADRLRVAAVQLPRLSALEREPGEADPVSATRKYLERDMRLASERSG